MARPNQAIAVLGAGTTGHGIAQVAAAAGYVVIMSDPGPGALARGVQAIERNLAKAIQLKKISEQTDLVGLDVRLHIAEYLHGKLGSEGFRPPEILRRMVSEGKLGKKVARVFTGGMSRKRVKEHILLNGSGRRCGVQPLKIVLAAS